MVETLVTAKRVEAGRSYLEALTALGFHPVGAMWSVRAGDDSTLELSIFSDLVDSVGTLSIYRALFDAYDKAKTPTDFDPWLVGLYSPRQTFFKAVAGFNFRKIESGRGAVFLMTGGTEFDDGVLVSRTVDFEVTRLVHPDWVYSVPGGERVGSGHARRNWRRFERNVNQAA